MLIWQDFHKSIKNPLSQGWVLCFHSHARRRGRGAGAAPHGLCSTLRVLFFKHPQLMGQGIKDGHEVSVDLGGVRPVYGPNPEQVSVHRSLSQRA